LKILGVIYPGDKHAVPGHFTSVYFIALYNVWSELEDAGRTTGLGYEMIVLSDI
jgi:hypothetical protein